MNLAALKLALEQPVSDEVKEHIILTILSQDEEIIPNLINLLSIERDRNKEIISDLNLEVSRYDIHVKDSKMLKKNLSFLNEETKSLYERWKGFISPLFNNKFQ